MIYTRFTLVVVASMVAAMLFAADSGRPGARPRAQNTIITLRLSVAGRTAIVKIPDKGCASVTTAEGQTIRTYVELVGDEVDSTTWPVSVDTEACAPPATAPRNKLATKGSTEVTVGETKLQIDLVTLAPLGTAPGGQGPCTKCCVMCQGVAFCGCEVDSACGRCCCPDACGCARAITPIV